MATSAERMRALRERARRRMRRLTIDVSEDDLQGLRNADTKVPQAPTTISRRKLSASSSTIAFSKSGRPDRCHSVSRDGVLRVTVSRLLGCTITPALRRNRCAVTPRCGATAGAVTASLFGTEVVLHRELPKVTAAPGARRPGFRSKNSREHGVEELPALPRRSPRYPPHV